MWRGSDVVQSLPTPPAVTPRLAALHCRHHGPARPLRAKSGAGGPTNQALRNDGEDYQRAGRCRGQRTCTFVTKCPSQ